MNLKIIILNSLNICHRHGSMSSKELLKRECEVELRVPVGDAEFEAALGSLTDNGFVSSIDNKLTNDRRYFITDLGRAQL